jgi:hypothetical protein
MHLNTCILVIELNHSTLSCSFRVVIPFDLVGLADVLELVLLEGHNNLFAHSAVSRNCFLVANYNRLKLLGLALT